MHGGLNHLIWPGEGLRAGVASSCLLRAQEASFFSRGGSPTP